MRINILSFTRQGSRLNRMLLEELLKAGHESKGYTLPKYKEECNLLPMEEGLSEWSREAFATCEGIIYIGACGIAVRAIAPYIKDKFLDPCIISVDEKGEYVIPLLSGHVGGGNALAKTIAVITGGVPVISTATDLNQLFAIDVFAKKNGLILTDRNKAKEISAALLEGTTCFLHSDFLIEGNPPKGVTVIHNPSEQRTEKKEERTPTHQPDARISIYLPNEEEKQALHLIPKVLCLGIGCRKGVKKEELEAFVLEQLANYHISIESIGFIGSIDLKKEEEALLALSNKYQWEYRTYSSEELLNAPGEFLESEFVKSVTGVGNVCERAAVLTSQNEKLIIRKTAKNGMTLAAAVIDRRLTFE